MKNSMTAQQLIKTFTKNEKKNKKTDINAVNGMRDRRDIRRQRSGQNHASAYDVKAYESYKRHGADQDQ